MDFCFLTNGKCVVCICDGAKESRSGFWPLARSHALSETRQRLAGLHQLFMKLCAALQHPCQLLQLQLHLFTVFFIDRVHVVLHLLAYVCHLRNKCAL